MERGLQHGQVLKDSWAHDRYIYTSILIYFDLLRLVQGQSLVLISRVQSPFSTAICRLVDTMVEQHELVEVEQYTEEDRA